MEQLNLFSDDNGSDSIDNEITVFKVNYEGTELTNWEELFSGFEKMLAITFSYDLAFIGNILETYDSAEIILGCEGLIKNDMALIMAHQNRTILDAKKYLHRHKNILKKVENSDISFYVSKDFTSHEKLFILEDSYGNSRIIFGSANFSGKAFKGYQGEIISVIDDDEKALYDFTNYFYSVQSYSTNEIVKETLLINESSNGDTEELPIAEEVKTTGKTFILENNESDEEIDYYTNLEECSRRYRKVLSDNHDEKDFIKLLTPKTVLKFKTAIKKEITNLKEKNRQYPKLTVDYEHGSVSLNDQEWIFDQTEDEIVSDINCFISFMNGYNGFIGDTEELKAKYFKIANYMFLSPFIARLRYESYKKGYAERLFPVFAILCGESDAGKSTFVNMIYRLMFGKKMRYYYSDDYTKTRIAGLLMESKGVPILVDDVVNKRFNDHSDEIIKFVDKLPRDNYEHPTIILTSNDIHSLKREYQKRCIMFHFTQKLDGMKAIIDTKMINNIMRRTTNSFYREYLKRIIPLVNEMIEKMNKESFIGDDYPDIFNLSSNVIVSILEDYDISLPDYARELTYDDYCGDISKSERAVKKLTDAWIHNKDAFEIMRRENVLKFTPGDKKYEADRIAKELPAIFDAKVVGLAIIMKLDETEKFLGMKFKKPFFKKKFK